MIDAIGDHPKSQRVSKRWAVASLAEQAAERRRECVDFGFGDA